MTCMKNNKRNTREIFCVSFAWSWGSRCWFEFRCRKTIRIPYDTIQRNMAHECTVHAAGCDLNAGRGSTPQFIVSLECSYAHVAAAYIVTSPATTWILTDNIYIMSPIHNALCNNVKGHKHTLCLSKYEYKSYNGLALTPAIKLIKDLHHKDIKSKWRG